MRHASDAAASGLQSQLLSCVEVNDVSVRIHGAAVRAKRMCRDRTLCKVPISFTPSLTVQRAAKHCCPPYGMHKVRECAAVAMIASAATSCPTPSDFVRTCRGYREHAHIALLTLLCRLFWWYTAAVYFCTWAICVWHGMYATLGDMTKSWVRRWWCVDV